MSLEIIEDGIRQTLATAKNAVSKTAGTHYKNGSRARYVTIIIESHVEAIADTAYGVLFYNAADAAVDASIKQVAGIKTFTPAAGFPLNIYSVLSGLIPPNYYYKFDFVIAATGTVTKLLWDEVDLG